MAEIPNEARIFKGPTRERVRRALVVALEEAMRADKKVISVAKLRSAGSKDQNCTTTMLRLWRSGALSMAESWDEPPPVAQQPAKRTSGDEAKDSDLLAAIQGAQSYDDLIAASKAVGSALFADEIDEGKAARFTNLLTEMRQQVKGRALEPKDVVESVLPVTEEAGPLVEAFEGIRDDERRAAVLAWVQAQAEEDRVMYPSLDTGGAQGEVGA